MFSLFRKKERGKTIVVLDVGSGSVASALVHLHPLEQPKLFGEFRVELPLLATRDSTQLARSIEGAARHALLHASEVAARLRANTATSRLGKVDQMVLFLHAPWVSLQINTPTTVETPVAPAMFSLLQNLVEEIFCDTRASFHSFMSAAALTPTLITASSGLAPVLICSINGEVSELLLVDGEQFRGHATLPVGLHTLLRTLMSHGGLSSAEARSTLALQTEHQALRASGVHFAEQFHDAASELLADMPVKNVLLVAPEYAAEHFARTLAHSSFDELFPDGGVVRAVRGSHILPHIAVHAPKPDLGLMLEALFADARFAAKIAR